MITKTQQLAIALCVKKLDDITRGDNDPDVIARFLEAEGIKGAIGSARACPIANYIYKNTPHPQSVLDEIVIDVAYSRVLVYDSRGFPTFRFLLDGTTCHFINLFDHRGYPNLIESGSMK